MSELIALAWLQIRLEQPAIVSNAWRALLVTALFLAFVITVIFVLLKYFRAQRNSSETAKVREEFEKGKEALLAAAMARKQAAGESGNAEREKSAEELELEALLDSVDPDKVIGSNCRICGLELSEDEELIIDPYTGAGYHLSSFLNDWPMDDTGQPLERPKFVYRYPQGKIVRSSDLVRSF